MRFAYVNAFVDSARDVLERVAGAPVTHDRPTLTVAPAAERGVATVIRLAGDLGGHVVFDLDAATARRLADRMAGDEAPAGEESLHDAMGELANMMIGRAVSALHDRGYRFTLSPPMVFAGGPVTFDVPRAGATGRAGPDVAETLVLTLRSALGDVVLQVGIAGA